MRFAVYIIEVAEAVVKEFLLVRELKREKVGLNRAYHTVITTKS